jgi:hypothetical protein
MTIVSAAFAVLGYLLLAMIQQNTYTLDAAIAYYIEIIDSLRPIFVNTLYEIYTSSGMPVQEELIVAVFDRQVGMIISYLLIGGFVVSGIGLKIFGAIVSRCSEDNTRIKNWRFTANKSYAYFYIILMLLSLFIGATDGIFAISVLNLYNIFSVIFVQANAKITGERVIMTFIKIYLVPRVIDSIKVKIYSVIFNTPST